MFEEAFCFPSRSNQKEEFVGQHFSPVDAQYALRRNHRHLIQHRKKLADDQDTLALHVKRNARQTFHENIWTGYFRKKFCSPLLNLCAWLSWADERLFLDGLPPLSTSVMPVRVSAG
jgi:hypothetical protein